LTPFGDGALCLERVSQFAKISQMRPVISPKRPIFLAGIPLWHTVFSNFFTNVSFLYCRVVFRTCALAEEESEESVNGMIKLRMMSTRAEICAH
jgi:hypothetical protein